MKKKLLIHLVCLVKKRLYRGFYIKVLHIFSKGNFIPESDGSSKMGNAPGVYFETKISTGTTTLDSSTNELAIFMETVKPGAELMESITEKILIEDVPLKRWFI